MTNRESPHAELDAALKHWRQGDYAMGVGGFLFANPTEGNDPFDAGETTENIVGLVIISQSCDIVRSTGGRDFVAVCPLVEVPEKNVSAILKGRRPYLTDVENAGRTRFADLSRIMSVHKNLLRTWVRQVGFTNQSARLRFAAALERKFGQFAFPDDFDQAIKEFRERVWSRYDKSGSEPGKVYRSLAQIRFRANPNWVAEKRTITVIAIMREEKDCEVGRDIIGKELGNELEKIKWPQGYEWGIPNFILATAKDFTAEDVITSQRGDFDFLCY